MQDRLVRGWFKGGGASEATSESFRPVAGFDFLTEYVDLLRSSNGRERPLPAPRGALGFDDVETACSFARAMRNPGRFVFAGNGGLELFAFDSMGAAPWPVVAFDGADPDGSSR